MRGSRPGRFVACALAAALLAVASASARPEDKSPAPGGAAKPPDAAKDPRTLTDAEKAERLAAIEKEYDDNRRNQDLVPVRTRRNGVVLAGDLRFAPAAKFLRKVFDEDRDTTTRVAALVAVGKCGDLDTIEYAVKGAISVAGKQPVYAASLGRMFSYVENKDARAWIVTRIPQKEDELMADVVEAVGEARDAAALTELVKLAESAKDPAVRFEALRACGRCGGKDAVPKLLPALADPDWRMRMAAVEGLGSTGQPEVIADLGRMVVRSEEPIVVETAVEALVRLGTKDALDPLIESLRLARLRARQKARAGLRALAKSLFEKDKDYGVDPNLWSSWWGKVKRGVDPDDPKINERETASYFSFPIESDRVLFVLDISGSMEWPNAPRDSGIKPSDWKERRIDVAHRELYKALRQLAAQNRTRVLRKAKKTDRPDSPTEEGDEPPTLFNVCTFAGVVTPWQKEAVLATDDNTEEAIAWLEKQLPRGGTATYDALDFGLAQKNIDTVYFLSDGVPSLGRYVERETILSEVRKFNRFKRTSIHTIALIIGISPIESERKYEDPDDMADFMGRLATENQGRFVNQSRQ